MKNIAISIVFLGFFGLIGYTIWLTGSALCLWALILVPMVLNNGEKPFIDIQIGEKNDKKLKNSGKNS